METECVVVTCGTGPQQETFNINQNTQEAELMTAAYFRARTMRPIILLQNAPVNSGFDCLP